MKFENTEVWGFEHALRGMRNPMNSWDKSDSYWGLKEDESPINPCDEMFFFIGEKDLVLAQTLIKAGSEHRKFMRQIFVSVDITAPLYWWKEFDTYKIGTTANSTSTMHKLASTPITIDCFETDDMPKDRSKLHGLDVFLYDSSDFYVNKFIEYLEMLRNKYLETNDKKYWKELVRWLPESWLQTRTITMTYENLFSMYHQRKAHKLNEWSGIDNKDTPNFISWMGSLPYAKTLIINTQKSN